MALIPLLKCTYSSIGNSFKSRKLSTFYSFSIRMAYNTSSKSACGLKKDAPALVLKHKLQLVPASIGNSSRE